MGDEAMFSDDISALWGPGDTGFFAPAPPRRTDENGDTGERVAALEGQVMALARAIEALRGDLDVLPAIQAGPSGSEEWLDGLAEAVEGANADLRRRLTALEADVQQALALVGATEAPGFASVGKRRARNVRKELHEEVAAELAAVRAAMHELLERRISEVETTVHRRLDDLSAQVVGTNPDERLAATQRRTALLAETVEAIRADLQAAADEIATRSDDRLTQQLHDLTAHLTQGAAADRRATDDRMDALEQRIVRLGELLESHRAQSVMGWELESLRTELVAAVRAMANGSEAEEERRRLEASWQQSMPGF